MSRSGLEVNNLSKNVREWGGGRLTLRLAGFAERRVRNRPNRAAILDLSGSVRAKGSDASRLADDFPKPAAANCCETWATLDLRAKQLRR